MESARPCSTTSGQLRSGTAHPRSSGVDIGEVFSFLSGLYFRGKLAYATSFASAGGLERAYTITSNRGLLPVQTPITLEELRLWRCGHRLPGRPLSRPAASRRATDSTRIPDDCEVILLGSVASGKYVEVLLEVFGNRLHFPADFVGRGDMSRGGLMLRCVEDQQELAYIPVINAVRRGARPPKLTPRSRKPPNEHDESPTKIPRTESIQKRRG